MARKNRNVVVDDLAKCVVKNKALVQQLENLGFRSSNPDGMTFEEVMICSQIANASKGDLKSYRAIMESQFSDMSADPLDAYLNGNVVLSDKKDKKRNSNGKK